MRNVNVTNDAADRISGLRTTEELNLCKSDIADSLTTLTILLDVGRNCEGIQSFTDDLLSVMRVIGNYNELLNSLACETDNKKGYYSFDEVKDDESGNK